MEITEDRRRLLLDQPSSDTPRKGFLKLRGDQQIMHCGFAVIETSWVHWLDDDADHWTSLSVNTVLQVQWIPRKKDEL